MRRLGSAYAQRTGFARSLYLVMKRRNLRARSVTEVKIGTPTVRTGQSLELRSRFARQRELNGRSHVVSHHPRND